MLLIQRHALFVKRHTLLKYRLLEFIRRLVEILSFFAAATIPVFLEFAAAIVQLRPLTIIPVAVCFLV